MKGYKAFDKDLKCRGTQFRVGEVFIQPGELEICKNGFHFCEKLVSVYNYYPKTYDTRVCEIEAVGSIKTEGDKSVCSQIKLVRELSLDEIKRMTDGLKLNSGNRNSGDYNSGDYNSGNYNSGYYNSGNYNSGNYNSGDFNSGNYNSGNYNSGNYNSGYNNSGYNNSGNRNSGYYNSGNYNSGYNNSGYNNSGNRNSGDYNSGDYNSGNYNSGYYNSGDFNSGNYNSGDFNTNEPTIRLFNKDSGLKRDQLPDLSFIYYNWKEHLIYVYSDSMTDQEKKDHPYHATTGGFLRRDPEYSYKKSWERVWSKITEEQKNVIKNLPNFCPKIFEEITGINVENDKIDVIINGVTKQISKKDAEKLGIL